MGISIRHGRERNIDDPQLTWLVIPLLDVSYANRNGTPIGASNVVGSTREGLHMLSRRRGQFNRRTRKHLATVECMLHIYAVNFLRVFRFAR